MAGTPEPPGRLSDPVVDADAFDEFYYANCCGRPYVRSDEWLTFFGGIADRIVTDIAPRRVLDAGCAMGYLVEALRARGVEAWGVDLSSYAIGQVDASVAPYCRVGSIAGDLGGSYDLIVSMEVVEHMPAHEAERAIANISRHTGDVLFSSSPDDNRELTHINVHPTEHWAELFARHELYRDVDYDASYVLPWAVRFRRTGEPAHRVVRAYERRFRELQLEARDARNYAMDSLQHIRNMERSRFWQMRLAWLRLKQLWR